ncbi:MAG TPA: hypothetical protein VHO68_04305 [Bacteroidales bacterium]|nr:hypothetical protein [Bacteroidales bacterium]
MMQKQIKKVIKTNDVEIIESTKGSPYEQMLKRAAVQKVDLADIASQHKTVYSVLATFEKLYFNIPQFATRLDEEE